MTYWVYILANATYATLYVGVTNSLERRVTEHKAKAAPGFTKRYGIDRLVYYRAFAEITAAIRFEKQLKRWRREWKIRLIEAENPHWADLYLDLIAVPPLHPDLRSIPTCHPGSAKRRPGSPAAEPKTLLGSA